MSDSDSIFHYVPRRLWGARQPARRLPPLQHPVPYLLLTYTNSPYCEDFVKCVQNLRDLQLKHIVTEKLPDIKYNWLIGSDGNLYEGVGWQSQVVWNDPRHAPYAANSIAVAFIDDFQKDGPGPSPRTLHPLEKLVVEGAFNNYITQPVKYIKMFATEDKQFDHMTPPKQEKLK